MPGRPLIMYLTVHEESMGCMLGQYDESRKKEQVIYYLSKKFTNYEAKYSVLEKTCCALAWAAHRLRQYMLRHTTWLISKIDPIKYIFEKPVLNGRIARWHMLLSEYDIQYVPQKAIKGSVIADYLAENPISDPEQIRFEFPDENIMSLTAKGESFPGGRWLMMFDGSSNAMGHGIGAILVSPKGKHYPMTSKLCFKYTNNIAEYEACAMGKKQP